MASYYGFHPEATEEYLAATQYYLKHASDLIAAAFVAEVENRDSNVARRFHPMGSVRKRIQT